ncbi:MAG: hypothetical protein ACRCYN_10120, partial [Plesiomonas sp.]
MQKKEKQQTGDVVSFDTGGKESFKDRLLTLMKGRTVRQAAKDWGLPYSTLNNYLVRETMPALNVAMLISQYENVDLSWLASGQKVNATNEKNTIIQPQKSDDDDLIHDAWLSLLGTLENEELRALLRVLQRKGVESIIAFGSEPPNIHTGIIQANFVDNLPIRDTAKQI